MCGITGMVTWQEDVARYQADLKRMQAVLSNRGPDQQGIYQDTHCAMAHTRLAVIDVERGKQPMTRQIATETYTLVYNGELYNTEDLRKELLEENYTFEAYCDTEVLLTAYIAWGINVVNKLNGIFAFAIYDEDKKQVFLARDPMGVKPLFYSKKGSKLIFGSEIKTILAHPEVRAEIDRDGLTELFALGPAVAPGASRRGSPGGCPPARCRARRRCAPPGGRTGPRSTRPPGSSGPSGPGGGRPHPPESRRGSPAPGRGPGSR